MPHGWGQTAFCACRCHTGSPGTDPPAQSDLDRRSMRLCRHAPWLHRLPRNRTRHLQAPMVHDQGLRLQPVCKFSGLPARTGGVWFDPRLRLHLRLHGGIIGSLIINKKACAGTLNCLPVTAQNGLWPSILGARCSLRGVNAQLNCPLKIHSGG